MKTKKCVLGAAVTSLTLSMSQMSLAAETFTEALTSGKVSADINIRYEMVDQDTDLVDEASALTMRTRLGYTTGELSGFSAMAEFEDVRIIAGMDEYTVGSFNEGDYSVIADPEVTELDQGFLQYKSGMFTAKLGRQVMVFDNHRFVGHVGWRQDRQTFDGLALSLAPAKNLAVNYNYIDQRNRIFGEAQVDSSDHLFNTSYTTSYGKFTGYAYLLEEEATDVTLDTFGLRFAGSKGKFSYVGEFASQTRELGAAEADANYLHAELGFKTEPVLIKGGFEVLGSDEGGYGFSTPLATGHAFNGWADQFLGTPNQGLVDAYVKLSGAAAGGNWALSAHSFTSEEDNGSGDSDLGKELDLSYTYKVGKHYTYGVKGAIYSAGDESFGKIDTSKLWLWVATAF